MAPEPSWPALDLFFASHPWHGIAIGPDAFEVIRRSQADYLDRFGETLGPLLAKG